MKDFAAKRPILFEIVLIVVSFAIALVFSFAGQFFGCSNELSTAIGRILAGILLLIVFFQSFDRKKQFSGFIIMLPALLFAVWNVANHFITHGDFAALSLEIVILGIAPAIFEEVIFRGIFIHNLKASGKSDIAALVISAVLFGVIHLTNAVGGDLLQALIQTCYAIVVGLVLGAIYVKSGDLVSVIIAHAAIDITNRVFMGGSVTPVPVIAAFVVLLAVEAAYSFILVSRTRENLE